MKPFSVRVLIARAEAHLKLARARRGYEQQAAAERGTLQLTNPEKGALEIAAQRGFEPPFQSFFASVTGDQPCACGAALRHQERLVVDDVLESPIFAGQPALPVLLTAGVRSVVSMCLVSAESALLGVLSTHFGVPRRPGERSGREVWTEHWPQIGPRIDGVWSAAGPAGRRIS